MDWTPNGGFMLGDKIMMDAPRSRWAILWDRIRHPFTDPARTEKKSYEVTALTSSSYECRPSTHGQAQT